MPCHVSGHKTNFSNSRLPVSPSGLETAVFEWKGRAWPGMPKPGSQVTHPHHLRPSTYQKQPHAGPQLQGLQGQNHGRLHPNETEARARCESMLAHYAMICTTMHELVCMCESMWAQLCNNMHYSAWISLYDWVYVGIIIIINDINNLVGLINHILIIIF